MKAQNSNHQLRFSIDLRSLKEHQFTAQLSLRYGAIAALGLASFRSPSIAIPNPRVETSIRDCFLTGYFQASMADVAQKLSQKLVIESWHSDRLKKDTLLGSTTIDLQKIIDMPLRTTTESFARVLDAYHPIDELDENGKPLKTIGSLRVIAYLEDLGPCDQLEKKGFNIKEFLEDLPEERNLPSRNQQNELPMENAGLNQLERKVVWELQTWKKSEETKARIILKHKQMEFWTNLSEQQRKSDLEKEKQFKKIEANLMLIEGKLRTKSDELRRREQKILLFEQELQTKIGEVSRQIMLKDQQIDSLKRRNKEEKNAVIKDKASVEVELAKTRAQNAKLKVEIEELRKEDEKSPLNILKAELNAKILQIKELSREVEKANQVKDEYKIYYGKMKDEVITLRQKLRSSEQSVNELQRQKDIVTNNYRHIEQQLAYQRQVYQQQMQRGERIHLMEQFRQNEDQEPFQQGSQRQRLIRQRQMLIRQQNYPASDPLIQHLDQQIRQAS